MSKVKIAWGLDPAGRLVHVTETATGLECNCKCPACGSKLEGVNVFNQGIRRPHFRHYELPGTEECGTRTATLALAKALGTAPKIMLPTLADGLRRIGATAADIVGAHFHDEYVAQLQLGNGRQLLVRLIAAGAPHPLPADVGPEVAVIEIQVTGQDIAAEDQDTLRRMLAEGLLEAKWLRYWPITFDLAPPRSASPMAAIGRQQSNAAAAPPRPTLLRVDWVLPAPSPTTMPPAVKSHAGIWRKWDWAAIYASAHEYREQGFEAHEAIADLLAKHGFSPDNNVVGDFLVRCGVIRVIRTPASK